MKYLMTVLSLSAIFLLNQGNAASSFDWSVGPWSPSPSLRNKVTIQNDCNKTKHAYNLNYKIYYCKDTIRKIDRSFPGVGHYLYVHEYMHSKTKSRNERIVEKCTAFELGLLPGGKAILKNVIKYYGSEGFKPDTGYGTTSEMIERIKHFGLGESRNYDIFEGGKVSFEDSMAGGCI